MDSAARNRDSQRRSRARQKAYIAELEQRVWTLEREGVKATLGMQAAARKVADENQLLRILLAQTGISNTQIDAYLGEPKASLHSAEQDIREKKLKSRTHAGSQDSPAELNSPVWQAAARQSNPLGLHGTLSPSVPHSLEQPVRKRTFQAETSAGDLEIQSFPNQLSTESASSMEASKARLSMSGADRLDGNSASSRSSPEELNMHTPHLLQDAPISDVADDCIAEEVNADSTTCEAAAMIIASMRGNPDPEAIWPELGCTRSNRCTIKNTTIFQLV